MIPVTQYHKTSLSILHEGNGESGAPAAGLSRQPSATGEVASRANSGRLTFGLYKTPSGGLDYDTMVSPFCADASR